MRSDPDPSGVGRAQGTQGAVAQLGERSVRNAEVRGSIPLGSTPVATIAQLVEHVTRNDGVVGSSPTGGSIAPWCNWQHAGFWLRRV